MTALLRHQPKVSQRHVKNLSIVPDRHYDIKRVERITPRSVYRPITQEYSFDMSKQEAISALSKILMKEIPN